MISKSNSNKLHKSIKSQIEIPQVVMRVPISARRRMDRLRKKELQQSIDKLRQIQSLIDKWTILANANLVLRDISVLISKPYNETVGRRNNAV